MLPIKCSVHYQQRFRERVAKKSKRADIFANRAFSDGQDLEKIADKRLHEYITHKGFYYASTAKVYRGNIYWFNGGVAVTVYPLPRALRGIA